MKLRSSTYIARRDGGIDCLSLVERRGEANRRFLVQTHHRVRG
ncbi:Hypothetical protein A7982_04713 [Minicystis rosea]|nr:Hypothetical protein A7982_04713 [Minicystis rosea]